MNKFIESYVRKTYGLEISEATAEDLSKVTEIKVRDVTMNDEYGEWDFTIFKNIKKIDCGFNPIKLLNISSNKDLEFLCFEGARGAIPHKIDFSGNPHLKIVHSGQDGVKELDFSTNYELEELHVFLSSSLRWLDVSNCTNLKKITLKGVNIPFVNLLNCNNLEEVNISYWNLYRNKQDEYGDGFPRPIIFVNEDFDVNIIDKETRSISYFTYYLVRVSKDSKEERFLNKLLDMKSTMLNIPEDYGRSVAYMHYKLLEFYKNL